MSSEGSDTVAEIDETLLEKINGLLAARLGAKLGRRFEEAYKCRDQLKALGVTLFDKERAWSYKELVKPDFGPLGHDYSRAADDKAELDDDVTSCGTPTPAADGVAAWLALGVCRLSHAWL